MERLPLPCKPPGAHFCPTRSDHPPFPYVCQRSPSCSNSCCYFRRSEPRCLQKFISRLLLMRLFPRSGLSVTAQKTPPWDVNRSWQAGGKSNLIQQHRLIHIHSKPSPRTLIFFHYIEILVPSTAVQPKMQCKLHECCPPAAPITHSKV